MNGFRLSGRERGERKWRLLDFCSESCHIAGHCSRTSNIHHEAAMTGGNSTKRRFIYMKRSMQTVVSEGGPKLTFWLNRTFETIFTFSYTKYTKRKYCNRQKIRTRDFDESPRFRPP
ncbi:hypothetical protein AVEN_5447-1 [Araneus ventricosus]|uniref:Uncharacterized protein n=1 Tax=Araneus ventricosus TaxID=182803 RepID=A0A4Y2DYN7_ARAVE|nr:hypothetical protein AVEN_5447-1 [Araneus ventricosus]